MTNGINLLPWRQEQHRQKLRQFGIKLAITLGIVGILLFTLSIFRNQQQQQLTQQSEVLTQTNQQFSTLLAEINQLKTDSQHLEIAKQIPTNLVLQILAFLPEMPFEQGELSRFSFDADKIQLQGDVKDQSEFEKINQFLNQQIFFQQVKLQQFNPDKAELFFQFELPLKSENKDLE